MRRDEQLDFSGIRTWSARERVNIVKIEDLKTPGVDPVPEWSCPDFDALVARIVKARQNGRPVVLSMGAHVIKNWLSRYLIALMRAGIVTHIAGNGACSIHDTTAVPAKTFRPPSKTARSACGKKPAAG